MQPLEHGAGTSAQFVGEQSADPLVLAQRLGLPSRPVPHEHELPGDPFVQRMRRRQFVQFADRLGVVATAEMYVDQVQLRAEPLTGQPVPELACPETVQPHQRRP